MTDQALDHAEARRKILVFCRPYLVADFRENLEVVADEFAFDFLTDGKCKGTRDTRAVFYTALKAGDKSHELTEDDLDEVTARCRLLRNIDQTQARRLAHAMAIALASELAECKPHAILSHWVDEYVTHLLSLLAAKRGIMYLGYAYSYFPGKAQLIQYAYGEAFVVRDPNPEEVDAVYEAVNHRAYRQNYLQPAHYTPVQHIKYMLRHRLKRLVFWTKGLLERDPWHLHYAITPFIVDRRRLSDYPDKSDFTENWQDRLSTAKAQRPGVSVVYLPFAYFPESAIDYWVQDRRILDYEDVTLEAINHLREHMIVVVKEHLHMLGARNRRFYDKLNALADVISVHPSEYSNDVLAASDAVLLGGGSVGLEASIRGKPIVSYCATSFWFDASGATALDLGDTANWYRVIASAIASHKPMRDSEKRDFIRQCLQSTVQQRGQGNRWLLIAAEDLRKMLNLALASAKTLSNKPSLGNDN